MITSRKRFSSKVNIVVINSYHITSKQGLTVIEMAVTTRQTVVKITRVLAQTHIRSSYELHSGSTRVYAVNTNYFSRDKPVDAERKDLNSVWFEVYLLICSCKNHCPLECFLPIPRVEKFTVLLSAS